MSDVGSDPWPMWKSVTISLFITGSPIVKNVVFCQKLSKSLTIFDKRTTFLTVGDPVVNEPNAIGTQPLRLGVGESDCDRWSKRLANYIPILLGRVPNRCGNNWFQQFMESSDAVVSLYSSGHSCLEIVASVVCLANYKPILLGLVPNRCGNNWFLSILSKSGIGR